jgi:hypothetical protein
MFDRIQKSRYGIILPWGVPIAAILAVCIFNVTRFSFFPEVDSYGWFFRYDKDIQHLSIGDYRPLFESLILDIHYLTGLSLFAIFKYVIPFFSLLTIIPLWLIARNLGNRISQTLVMLFPLASPVVIFQSESTRPQSVAVIFLFFMIAFIVESYKKDIFIYLALLVGIVGLLYHQIFIFFLLATIVGFMYVHREVVYRNRLKFFSYAVLAAPWIYILDIQGIIFEIPKALLEIFTRIFIQLDTNFRFPAWYINSDGIQMGWKNLWGVMKYYAFYAGPVSFLIMLLVAFFSFSNKFRSFLSRELNGAFTISIYFLISLFLLITEVLPRIGNIAYLPDRAWTFLGILFIFLLFQVLMYLETESLLKAWVKNSIYISFFCAFTISIIGSIYVVNSIKYTLPEYQLKSFEWIQNNLESDRVIFYSGYPSILQYHSNSTVLPIDKEALRSADMKYFIALFISNDILKSNNKLLSTMKSEISRMDFYIDSIQLSLALNHGLISDQIFDYASSLKSHSDLLVSTLKNYDLQSKNIYIYYAKSSDKNPFNDRMYDTGYSSQTEKDEKVTLDQYPDYFKRVYDTGDVIIWKYIGNQEYGG